MRRFAMLWMLCGAWFACPGTVSTNDAGAGGGSATGGGSAAGGGSATGGGTASGCAALPAPTGNVVDVTDVTSLVAAVNNAQANDTIRLADGTYALNGAYVYINKPGVTLR